MQLTRFDRWLREKFVYETHIHTLRPPVSLPAGIRVVQMPDIPGRRYKHLFVARTTKQANQLIRVLKEESQMYTTQVQDRKAWYIPYIAPKGKSVTWRVISIILICISIFTALLYVRDLMDNPTFQENLQDAIKVLKG